MDCRWLGRGGAGRATELLLRGLQRLQPPGDWVLWGPQSVAAFVWPGARCIKTRSNPLQFWGQRTLGNRLPSHDLALFMHQIRPWSTRPSVTLVHDTIPLHFGNKAKRELRRIYLRAVCRGSRRVMTISGHSKRAIEEELRVSSGKVDVVEYPVDPEMSWRIRRQRERPAVPEVLYVGRFAPHKNLPTLIRAFQNSGTAHAGGRLRLIGGTPNDLRDLGNDPSVRENVLVQGMHLQVELERAYARASCVILPSLDEGFGFPPWEALAAGVPVAISWNVPFASKFDKLVIRFDPRRPDAIAAAIDAASAGHPGNRSEEDVAAEILERAPSVEDFGRRVVQILQKAAYE